MKLGNETIAFGIVVIWAIIAIGVILFYGINNETLRNECINYCHENNWGYSNYDGFAKECHCNGELNNKIKVIE